MWSCVLGRVVSLEYLCLSRPQRINLLWLRMKRTKLVLRLSVQLYTQPSRLICEHCSVEFRGDQYSCKRKLKDHIDKVHLSIR